MHFIEYYMFLKFDTTFIETFVCIICAEYQDIFPRIVRYVSIIYFSILCKG